MIILRPASEADYLVLSAMRRDADLQRMLMSNAVATAAEPVEVWLERRVKQGYLKVIADENNAARGFVQLAGVHRRNGTGWLGIAVERGSRGCGIGRAAMIALEHWAIDDLGLRKLKLEVMLDNKAAQALYSSIGYQSVGVLRVEFFDGLDYHDTLIMEKVISK